MNDWDYDDQKADKTKKRKPLDLHLKKGALHAQLGIAQGEKIPVATLEAAKARGGKLAKRAQFALNARSWKH